MPEFDIPSNGGARPRGRLARFRIPDVAHLLPRPRVTGRIVSDLRQGVLWIAGPPGCGKTSAAAQFAAGAGVPTRWWALDRRDDAPAAFAFALAEALGVDPGDPATVRETCAAGLAALVEDIVSRAEGPLLLVLDGHDFAASGAVSEGVLALIRAGSPEMRLLITGRADPPPSAAHLFAYRRASRIGWEELRFSDDEMQAYLGREGGISAGDGTRVQREAMGWIAGAAMLRASDRGAAQLAAYFEQEVLEALPPGDRERLAVLSLAPTLSADAALALTGEAAVASWLAPLAERRWFVYPRPDRPGEYDIHPLLRSALRERLLRTCEGAARVALYQRAIDWALGLDAPEHAIALFAELQAWERLQAALVDLAPRYQATGRLDELLAWIERLPPRHATEPWLRYWQGLATLRADPPRAARILEAALREFEASGHPTGAALTCAALVECRTETADATGELPRWIDRLLAAWPACADLADDSVTARVLAVGDQVLRWRFSHPVLRGWVARALELRHATPDRDLAERLTVFCAAFHFWHGEAARAAAILHTLPVESPNDLTAIAARLVGALVPSDHPRFHPPETQALPPTQPVVLDSRACRLLDIFTGEPVLRAALSAAGIPALIQDETQRQDTRPFGSTLVSRRIAELVGRGAYLEAARVQDLAIEMERQALGALNLARSIARSGQLHALAQDFRAALEALDDALTRCRDMGCEMLALHVQLWRAHCLLGLGEQQAADEALTEALRRSAASGVIEGHPWWQPARSGLLAARALALGIEREYVFRWIRMRDLPPPSADIDDWPWPLRIYTLGRFSIVADGSALAFQGKSQKKPLDLLKAAIAMGGSEIAITLLMEALWPEADPDAARKAFDVALLRLRRLLGRDDAISIADGRLSVNAKVCWVDLVSLERLASTVDRMTDTAQRHRATLETLSRYRGSFLQLDEPQPWMAAARERIAGKVRRLVLAAGRALEEAQRLPEAIDLYERAVEVQPCAEPLYRQLMGCLAATGAHAEAREVYQRCRSMLGAVSGTTPSRDTEDVLASLRG